MHRFEIIVFWSGEDEGFIANVPELPGCKTHGNSQREALGNAQEAIELWLDTALEFRNPVPEPNGRQLMYPWFRPRPGRNRLRFAISGISVYFGERQATAQVLFHVNDRHETIQHYSTRLPSSCPEAKIGLVE